MSESLIFHPNAPVFSCESGAAKSLSKAPLTLLLVRSATLTSYGKQGDVQKENRMMRNVAMCMSLVI